MENTGVTYHSLCHHAHAHKSSAHHTHRYNMPHLALQKKNFAHVEYFVVFKLGIFDLRIYYRKEIQELLYI